MQRQIDLSELLQEPLKGSFHLPSYTAIHCFFGVSFVECWMLNACHLFLSDLRPIPAISGHMTPYPVHFPLARPSADNIQAICSHSAHRPRYPEAYFPLNGYGQLKRRATAVNNGEFWFSDCCQQNATWGSEATLCCATQAVSLTSCWSEVFLVRTHPNSPDLPTAQALAPVKSGLMEECSEM